MRPRKQESAPQDDLFRLRLENMIDMKHPLVQLASKIHWESFEQEWGVLFHDRKGAPAIPTRLIAGLHYLKHSFGHSDEEVVAKWIENPYWQYFCGEEYFQHQFPIHPTSMTRWRKRIGEEGAEWLLSNTIDTAIENKVIHKRSIERVSVDTTVQEKNITYPTDSKLYEKARERLVIARIFHSPFPNPQFSGAASSVS